MNVLTPSQLSTKHLLHLLKLIREELKKRGVTPEIPDRREAGC